jgi:hypothetical protein
MDVFTDVSWPKVVDCEWSSIEDEDNMHAQAVTVELQTLLWVLDTRHQMIEAVSDGWGRAGPWRRDDVFAHLIWPRWVICAARCHDHAIEDMLMQDESVDS